MENVFLVQHLHILPHGEEDIKIIGIYSSRELAIAAIDKVKDQPGFSEYPKIVTPEKDQDNQGFYIDAYVVNMDHWETGYFTE